MRIPSNKAIVHNVIVILMNIFFLTHPLVDDCKCQEATSQTPRTIDTPPKMMCASVITDSLAEGCTMTEEPKLTKDGPITSRKDIKFMMTAASIKVPCFRNLAFDLNHTATVSMAKMAI